MASRAIWTGSLSFGLVNVPIGLFTATDDKAIHFNQFQAGTTDRIRYKRVNERTGEEVANEDVGLVGVDQHLPLDGLGALALVPPHGSPEGEGSVELLVAAPARRGGDLILRVPLVVPV